MKVSSLFVGMALLLLMPSCSDESDPIKSYSNYEVVTSVSSPIVFSNLGERKEITVSASKEVCWDGKPSGTTEPVVLCITAEGEQFSVETTQNGGSYQLRITAKENQEEAEQFGKITITTEGEATVQSQVIELRQDAATVEYGAYKIAFAQDSLLIPWQGGEGAVAFNCQREKSINGKSQGFKEGTLKGIRYEASLFNDLSYRIEANREKVGSYTLHYSVKEMGTCHGAINVFNFLNPNVEDEVIASFRFVLEANPNGEDAWFVSQGIDEIYQGE